MSVSEKIKAMLVLTSKMQMELAAEFGMSKQTMSNKMAKDSWSAKDLIHAAEYCGCKVMIVLPDGQQIQLTSDEKSPDA